MERSDALVDAIKTVFYPEHCLGCDVPGSWVCPACLADVSLFHEPQRAPLLPSGRSPLVSSIFAASSYAEHLWNEMIRALKYEQLHGLADAFRVVLRRYRTDITPHWIFGMGEGWTLVPIPTNIEHVDERGSDHMETWYALLRELLPEALDGRKHLFRCANGSPQARFLTKGAREQAMIDGFLAIQPPSLRILLIDDVYTTGSTVQAAAEAFRNAGAEEVRCFTAAVSFHESTST